MAIKSFVGKNAWAMLKQLLDKNVIITADAGVPTSGTSGTGVNFLGPGSIYIDLTAKNAYMNTNTAASPTWTSMGPLVLSNIPLATGSVLVGTAGVAAALNGKTSGQILIGNGTTMISVAVSGDVTISAAGVTAIGANKVTSAMMALNVIQTKQVALTNAQIKAIRATPILMVAAPGVGFFVQPISCIIELVYGGSNAFTAAANDNLALKWKDGSIAAIMQGAVQAFVQATASAYSVMVNSVAAGSTINVAKTNVDNQALVLHNITASEIAGNAGLDNTMNVTLTYAIQASL